MNINDQINILRSLSSECHNEWKEELEFALSEAADTIESLATKLQATNTLSMNKVIEDFESKLECTKAQLELLTDCANKNNLSVKNEILFFRERAERYEEMLSVLRSFTQANIEQPTKDCDLCEKILKGIAEEIEMT